MNLKVMFLLVILIPFIFDKISDITIPTNHIIQHCQKQAKERGLMCKMAHSKRPRLLNKNLMWRVNVFVFCIPRYIELYPINMCLETWHRIGRTLCVLHEVRMTAISIRFGAGLNLLISVRVIRIKSFMTYLTQHFCINLGGMHLMGSLRVA